MKNYSESTLVIAAAVASWLAAALLPAGLLRLVLTLPLVLWLPGYALLAVAHRPFLRGLAGSCFIVGVSMSTAIGLGYLLHVLGCLNSFGWASALAATVIVPTVMTSRNTEGPRVAFHLSTNTLAAWLWPNGLRSRIRVAMMLAALSTAGVAFAVARDGVTSFREFKYSELWVVPEGAHRKDTLRIGVRNMEGAPAIYELELRFDGKLIGQWKSIAIADGAEWTAPFSVPFQSKSANRAEVRLFKSDDPDRLYRQAWLNIPLP